MINMHEVSDLFKTLIKAHDRAFEVKCIVDGIEYSEADVISIDFESDLVGDDFEVGTVIPDKLTLQIKLDENPYKNAPVEVYIRLDGVAWDKANVEWEAAEGTWEDFNTEYIPIGKYYIDSRSSIGYVYTLTCVDELIKTESVYFSNITNLPTTPSVVVNEICSNLSLELDEDIYFDDSIEISHLPAEITYRAMLGWIASLHGGSFKLNRFGKLTLIRFSQGDSIDNITSSNYFSSKKYSNLKEIKKIEVRLDDQNSLTIGEGNEEQTLHIENPYITQTILEQLYEQLNGLLYVPISLDYREFLYLDPGDWIDVEEIDSPAWEDAISPWDEMDEPWDGIKTIKTLVLNRSFKWSTGLQGTIDTPGKSDQESEYEFTGTLTGKVQETRKQVYENKAEITVLDTSITLLTQDVSGNTSSIAVLSDEIELKVDKAGVIASINLSPETVTIDAAKINLIGAVTVLSNISGDLGEITAGDINGARVRVKNGTTLVDIDPSGSYVLDIKDDNAGSIFTVDDSGNGVFYGSLTSPTINGGTINGISINSADIDISEDVSIGNKLYIDRNNFDAGIRWVTTPPGTAGDPEIYIDSASQAMFIESSGGIYANNVRIDTSGITYEAGNGLVLNGNEFDVDPSRIAGYGLQEDSSMNLEIDEYVVVTSPSSQNIEFQYFYDHIEVRSNGGTWKVIPFV